MTKTMVQVKGKTIDDETRCVHWHADLDIIALKFKCCGEYYPCYECHEETAGHPPLRYSLTDTVERKVVTVLCGKCGNEMTFEQYSKDVKCTSCASQFNPGCKLHYDLYFDKA